MSRKKCNKAQRIRYLTSFATETSYGIASDHAGEQRFEFFSFGCYVRVFLYEAIDRARHRWIPLDNASKRDALTSMMIAVAKMVKVGRDITHQIVVREVPVAENAQLAFQKGQEPLEVRVLNMPRYCGVHDNALP